MNLPALVDFTCQRHDNFSQSIYLLHNPSKHISTFFDFAAIAESEKIDTTGLYAQLEIRKQGKWVKRLTNNGIGGITTDRGILTFSLSDVETQALKPDKYQYELRIIFPSGETLTYIKGFFRILIDQDTAPERVLIIGNTEGAYLLPTKQQPSVSTPPDGDGNTGGGTQIGSQTARLFFKTPNGRFFVQWMDNNGELQWLEDYPSRYPNTLIILPPIPFVPMPSIVDESGIGIVDDTGTSIF
jgi:hypothetical protein